MLPKLPTNSMFGTKSLMQRQSHSCRTNPDELWLECQALPEQIFARKWVGLRTVLCLRRLTALRKDKVAQDACAPPLPPAASPRMPENIFANWREMLHQLKLATLVRTTCVQAIGDY